MFHLRLKSDKKPNGTTISAVQHVDYIRHEGVSSPTLIPIIALPPILFLQSKKKTLADGKEFWFYKTDDFDSIKNSKQGIEVTENASAITIAVALNLADETMKHQSLIIPALAILKNQCSIPLFFRPTHFFCR